MKKFLGIMVLTLVLISTGCFGKDSKGSYEALKKKVKNANGYSLSGILEIINNDEVYKYDVNVGYKKDDYYRVSLKNQTNDHEQIILKNKSGVYVLTPSLNKSFKFQSDWPNNNSHVYLLQAVISDIENDDERKTEKIDGNTVITTKVNYTNNTALANQKIYLDEDSNVKKVEVYDKDNNVKIKMNFDDINFKPKFDDKYFEIEGNKTENLTKETLKEIKDITYPMYIPDNTYLQSQDTMNTTNGERVILTFAGDKSFTIVEEVVNVPESLETINMSGEPALLLDTIGVIDEKSVSWISNGIEYYAMSNDMNTEELVKVANSISNTAIEK